MRAALSVFLQAVLLFVTVGALAAQDTQSLPPETPLPAPNAIYLEGLGNGGLFSLNYERMVSPVLGVRVGFAAWEASDFWGGTNASFLNLPLTVSYLPGGRGSGWEVGGGLLVGRVRDEDPDFGLGGNSGSESKGIVNLTAILGYRWVSEGRWLFRVGFTPFYSLRGGYPDDQFFPSMGLSLGKAF